MVYIVAHDDVERHAYPDPGGAGAGYVRLPGPTSDLAAPDLADPDLADPDLADPDLTVVVVDGGADPASGWGGSPATHGRATGDG